MNFDDTPKTIATLVKWMQLNCFNFETYSINTNHINDGNGILKDGNSFIWHYTERGEKRILNTFTTEEEVVAKAFEEIKSDKWAQSHCIGFTTLITEHNELAAIMTDIKIEFFQDQIPYYISDELIYRTFVFGCDINKTEFLKIKYLHKP